MNRLTIFFAFFLIFSVAGLSGQAPLEAVLPSLTEADYESFLTGTPFLRFHGDGVSPGLLPETPLTAAIAREIIAGDLNIGIEGLFFTPMNELPQGYQDMESEERELRLYNILRSVSTLEGLEYYSASRGEMRLLFEESWRIADPGSREPLPDPFVDSVPEEDHFYIHQKDKSFGKNQSVMNFKAREGVFAVGIINQSPMRYMGLLKVVEPHNMQIHLIVVPSDDGLLLYGTMSARTKKVKAFMDRAQNSFTNRVVALTGWYASRLIEEF